MQGFDLALFQHGAADQPSILLKHLDPNTRQEAQQDIAAYKSKLKDEREQKKQKTVQARAANLPADLTEQQRRRMPDGYSGSKDTRSEEEETPRRTTSAATTTEDGRRQEEEKPRRTAKKACDVSSLQRSENQGCLYESCMVEVDEKEGTCAL